MPGFKSDLASLSAYTFSRIRTRLEGLGDYEYFWEPAKGAWNARPAGDGTLKMESAPLADDPPVTSIAWRLWHLVACYGSARNAMWLGVAPQPAFEHEDPVPPTAERAVAALEAAHRSWATVIEAVPEAAYTDLLGDIAGPYAEEDKAAFILHQLDEVIHHGAEIALLRDLFRAQHPSDELVDAALHGERRALQMAGPAALDHLRAEHPDLLVRAVRNGRWAGVPVLLELGYDAAAGEPFTPLHLAAAAGHRPTIDALLAAGADKGSRDQQWNLTPLGWARYFKQADVFEVLASSTDPA